MDLDESSSDTTHEAILHNLVHSVRVARNDLHILSAQVQGLSTALNRLYLLAVVALLLSLGHSVLLLRLL